MNRSRSINCLDPDQARPDLGPNCFNGYKNKQKRVDLILHAAITACLDVRT